MTRQIVLDTETTGLNDKLGDSIIEIGCIEIASRRFTDRNFHAYLNPERDIDQGAATVHGLTREFLADKPRFAEVAKDFIAYVEGAELVIHNADFDVEFLDLELKRAGLGRLTDYAAKITDTQKLQETIERLEPISQGWPDLALQQYQSLRDAAAAGNFPVAQRSTAFLRNVLLRDPSFRRDLTAVQTPVEQVAELITTFLRLPVPQAAVAPPDDSLRFFVEPITVPEGDWDWIGTFSLAGEGPPAVVVANGREARVDHAVTLGFPGGEAAVPPTLHGITGLDYNYDFKTDLAMAGPGGLRVVDVDDGAPGRTDAARGMALGSAAPSSRPRRSGRRGRERLRLRARRARPGSPGSPRSPRPRARSSA